jgi:hypothetical protein
MHDDAAQSVMLTFQFERILPVVSIGDGIADHMNEDDSR